MDTRRPDTPRTEARRRGTRRARLLRPTVLGPLAACALAAGLLLLPSAPERKEGPASGVATADGIRIREARLVRTPDAWRLDARADIELPPAIRSGLDSGVPLEFVLDVSLGERRRLAPDPVLLSLERRYALVYYELTRHYRVRSLDDGTARNYRSLGTALDGLGNLERIRLEGPPAGSRTATLVGRLSLRLDGRALPLPLQSPFGSAWRLASRPHVWTLPSADEGPATETGEPPDDAAVTLYRERRP